MQAQFKVLLCFIVVTFFQPTSLYAEKYRIAVIIPLSGQVASLGNYVRKGIELARERLSSREKDASEILYEDDQFNPTLTVAAYRRLTSLKALHAVVVLGSPTAEALAPITEKDGVILVSVGGSNPSITMGRKFSFIHWVIPSVLGETLGAEIKLRDYKKIALISAETAGAVADIDAAATSLKKAGLGDRIVYRNTFPADSTDYRAVIARLREKQVNAVILVLFPGALAPFSKQARDAHLAADLVGMETFEDESEVKSSDGALVGSWYVNASNPTAQFVGEYTLRYAENPGWAAANAYDTAMLIAKAATKHGTDNQAVSRMLATLDQYEGAAGTYSASGDHRFTLPASLKVVTENGFRKLR